MRNIRDREERLLRSRWFEQSRRTALDCALWDKVWEFGNNFFGDMLFEQGSITNSFLKCSINNNGEWIEEEFPRPNGFRYFSYEDFYYRVRELKDPYLACFSYRNYSLTVDPRYLDDDFPILHEMIHMHEFVLDIYPQYYREVILFCLYKDLCGRVNPIELDEKIRRHMHIPNQRMLAQKVGKHDLLFLLKSFDLDLKMGYKLGTVFGYEYDQ